MFALRRLNFPETTTMSFVLHTTHVPKPYAQASRARPGWRPSSAQQDARVGPKRPFQIAPAAAVVATKQEVVTTKAASPATAAVIKVDELDLNAR